MAQLSDDCFAFGGQLMPVDQALALIGERLSAISQFESAPLMQCDGRILARDLVASIPLPPFTNSAVDGYAVHAAVLNKNGVTRLRVAGRIEAGGTLDPDTADNIAIRIFTGAQMPAGFDTVFMQEDVTLGADSYVELPAGLKSGANMRPAGEDIEKSSVAIAAGSRLTPQHIALAAALGQTHLTLARKLSVAVFSTGNELVSPGQTQSPPQVYDSNRFMLMALLVRLGCEISDLGILRDDRTALAQALTAAASNHDLIVTSGGVSTGDADHVKGAVEDAGTLTFWRIAIKPGRPVAMGVIAGTPFIGLPGNPVASFVTQAYVVRPAVLALMGARPVPIMPLPVRAAFSYSKKSGRREYARATLRRAADGVMEAVKFPREGAGLLSSLVETDGLIELGEDITRVEPGGTVGFIAYPSLY